MYIYIYVYVYKRLDPRNCSLVWTLWLDVYDYDVIYVWFVDTMYEQVLLY